MQLGIASPIQSMLRTVHTSAMKDKYNAVAKYRAQGQPLQTECSLYVNGISLSHFLF